LLVFLLPSFFMVASVVRVSAASFPHQVAPHGETTATLVATSTTNNAILDGKKKTGEQKRASKGWRNVFTSVFD
jgi:hypothetical protein